MATIEELQSQIQATQAEVNTLTTLTLQSGNQASTAYSAYQNAQQVSDASLYTLNGNIFDNKQDYINATYNEYVSAKDQWNGQLAELNQAKATLATLENDLEAIEDPTSTVKTPSSVNDSQSDLDTQEKYQNADATDATDENSFVEGVSYGLEDFSPTRSVPGVPSGAEPIQASPPQVNFRNLLGDKSVKEDLRVRIKVPRDYLQSKITQGPNQQLGNLQGIIFPYTPSIVYELKADYSTTNPLHSNFPINFYQRSTISSISISGKFTVEDEKDAGVYISTVHLLKALTRMRFGKDQNRGAPPPVCRLYAYGQMMLENVPIAITSFGVELPDNVDYFTFKNADVGLASVPTISTIAITCITMYSRNEMQKFSVSGYLNNAFKGQGII